MTLRNGALSCVLEIMSGERSLRPHAPNACSNNQRALRCSSLRLSVLKVRISSQSTRVRVEGSIDLIWQVATSRRTSPFSSMKSNVAFNASPLAFECEFLIIRNWCHCLQSKASHSNYRRFIIANNQDIVDSDSCIFDMCTYRTQPQLLVFFRNT